MGFFSSQVATGMPLRANSRSTVCPRLGWQGTCLVMVSWLALYFANVSGLRSLAGLKKATLSVCPEKRKPCRSTSSVPRSLRVLMRTCSVWLSACAPCSSAIFDHASAWVALMKSMACCGKIAVSTSHPDTSAFCHPLSRSVYSTAFSKARSVVCEVMRLLPRFFGGAWFANVDLSGDGGVDERCSVFVKPLNGGAGAL